MSGLYGILNIGKLGILAEQKALSVTSQNIANVNTPGYTRQDSVFEETIPVSERPGQIGTGVQVTEIRRLVNQFIENQITSEQSNLGRHQIDQSILGRVEAAFNDAQGTGISQSISDFFAALHDLSNNPQDRSGRVALLEQAKTMSQQFTTTRNNLLQIRKDLNAETVGVISDVNSLAKQIAGLNEEISKVENTGQHANDLRDERGRLLNDLASKIDFQTFEDNQGRTTVMVGGGKPLVEGNSAHALLGTGDPDNLGYVKVFFDPGSGSTTDITSAISNGRLKGLIDLRDNLLPGYIDRLDRLAAGIVNEVNQQHRAGYGLDGSTGNDFFSPLAPTVSSLSANTGSGVINATIATPASLTFNPYQLSFAGGNYTVTNLATGAATTAAYVNPTTVTFEGIQIAMSGAPANGDVFNISAHQGAAAMGVALTDPNRVAAASLATALPGDNGNALLLAQLQDKAVAPLNASTFQGFYGSLVGVIGADSQSAQKSLTAENVIQGQLGGLRDQTSGVSLDEEMANLIKFQRAFEASARLITMADDLMQTILDMKR